MWLSRFFYLRLNQYSYIKSNSMLRSQEIKRYSPKLQGGLLGRYYEEDVIRYKNNYYGLKTWTDSIEYPAVFIGVRSGFEVIRMLHDYDLVKIIVVEGNDQIIKELISVLDGCEGLKWSDRVYFCQSMAALADLIRDSSIGLIRVDIEKFYWLGLLEIFNKYTVNYICGEFDPVDVDPMDVYRVSRDKAKSFYWRVLGAKIPLVQRAKKCLYEVSVVIPAYKVLPWIDRCISSLVEQNLESIEIIAVDDGSPDDTGKRLDEWALKYPQKVRVIHKKNGGCASARNCGLYEARGEYVAFVDADDWVDRRMFSELYRSAIMNGTDVAECGYAEYYENSGKVKNYPSTSMSVDKNEVVGFVNDPRTHLVAKPTIWRRIYRKEFLTSNSICFPEHIRRFDDLPFQFEVFSRVAKMSQIPECYYFYRQEREGQDVMVRDHRLFVHFKIFDWLHDRVGGWCDTTVNRYMLQCKINTHRWALSKIEKKYLLAYLRAAINDIVHYHGSIDRMELFAKVMRRGGPIILAGILLVSLLGSGNIPDDN